MKRTGKLARFFKFFWLSEESPNMEWDVFLNTLMDIGTVTSIDEHHITFDNKYSVWIANHPYSSGELSENTEGLKNGVHCKKETKIRLEDYYYENIFNKKVLEYKKWKQNQSA